MSTRKPPSYSLPTLEPYSKPLGTNSSPTQHARRHSEPASSALSISPAPSTFGAFSVSYEPWNARLASRKSPSSTYRHRPLPPILSSSSLSCPPSECDSDTGTALSSLIATPQSNEVILSADCENDEEHLVAPSNPSQTIMSDAAGTMKRKVVIMGSPSVGKTSITQQYVSPPTYNASYYPTIEDTAHKTVKHNGVQYECEIIDSAGLEEYSLFPGKYGIGVHGYMLVYSITSRQSFEMIPIIHDKILDYAGLEKVPCVVVGQKTDLGDERAVSTAEGEELAKKLRAGFIESSAKDNKNVVKAFDVLLVEMQREYNPAPEKKKSSWWGWGK
ncbi:hypothetical protein IAU60_002308 [Kwoniella sp. DSM 27419]